MDGCCVMKSWTIPGDMWQLLPVEALSREQGNTFPVHKIKYFMGDIDQI